MSFALKLAAALVCPAGCFILPGQQLVLPNQQASAGSSVLLPAVFAPRAEAPVSSLQFDLHYNSPALSLAATVGEAIRVSGKSLLSYSLAPGRLRFLVSGLNQTPIPAGVLMNLFAHLSPAAPSGAYALKISDIVAAAPDGQLALLDGVDGGLTVTAPSGPLLRLQSHGVLNGASLLPGPVAPGEILTLIGSGIGPATAAQPPPGSASATALNGTRVLFDETPAPLLYASANQINAVVPYSVSQKVSTKIQIVSPAGIVAELVQPVAASSPALFTQDATGAGPGAILNQDSTLNTPSNPAVKGSVVSLYATGAGQTAPAGVDGRIMEEPLPKPLLPVTVQIGGVDAVVEYAGAAPGQIAGLLQVNCTIPVNAPSGNTVPVVLRIGQAIAQTGVTIAVH